MCEWTMAAAQQGAGGMGRVDLSSIEAGKEYVNCRRGTPPLAVKMDSGNLRPMREVRMKPILACRGPLSELS
jgi:hypothetical protein